jgi:hypothetical protein
MRRARPRSAPTHTLSKLKNHRAFDVARHDGKLTQVDRRVGVASRISVAQRVVFALRIT